MEPLTHEDCFHPRRQAAGPCIFRNPLAVGLTMLGGILFAWCYWETGSLFTAGFEHALYGCWLFTVGLGQYFYRRALPPPR
jgi:hypothetical protein